MAMEDFEDTYADELEMLREIDGACLCVETSGQFLKFLACPSRPWHSFQTNFDPGQSLPASWDQCFV